MSGRRVAFAFAVPAILGLSLVAHGRPAGAQTSEPAAKAHEALDVSDCKTCHEKVFTRFETTPHAGLEAKCASCHGSDVESHLKSNLEKGEPGTSTQSR